MMASIPEYNAYAQEVLAPQMDPKILKELQQMEKKQ
jgi:proline iminopeptidase